MEKYAVWIGLAILLSSCGGVGGGSGKANQLLNFLESSVNVVWALGGGIYSENPLSGVSGSALRHIALMTGQIVTHMLNSNASRAVADAYGLTVEAEFRDISRIFFGTQPNQSVIELTELLSADIAVESAEIDIIEEFYEPF